MLYIFTFVDAFDRFNREIDKLQMHSISFIHTLTVPTILPHLMYMSIWLKTTSTHINIDTGNYGACMKLAKTHPEGASVRTDFERGCKFMNEGIKYDSCIATCSAFYGNAPDCCECTGRCHTCNCAHCASFCQNFQPTGTVT